MPYGEAGLTGVLRIGARPSIRAEWWEPLADEGLRGTAAIAGRALLHPETLPRLAARWRTFNRYRDQLGAIALTATHG